MSDYNKTDRQVFEIKADNTRFSKRKSKKGMSPEKGLPIKSVREANEQFMLKKFGVEKMIGLVTEKNKTRKKIRGY